MKALAMNINTVMETLWIWNENVFFVNVYNNKIEYQSVSLVVQLISELKNHSFSSFFYTFRCVRYNIVMETGPAL